MSTVMMRGRAAWSLELMSPLLLAPCNSLSSAALQRGANVTSKSADFNRTALSARSAAFNKYLNRLRRKPELE